VLSFGDKHNKHNLVMDNPYEQQQTALVSRIINNVVKYPAAK
jgi:hypothetical protein